MPRILSAVPNICEGRDEAFINALVQKLNAVRGLMVLDVARDTVHNRTIIALSGSKEAVFEGGFVMYDEAIKNIDMRKHEGEYPRIGALDVFPFVPLKDITMAEAVEISREFAAIVAERFHVPVYLFSESAQYPSRREIDSIREGEYEGLEKKLKDPRWKPDFGTDEFRPDFGATVIGARYPLISFIVSLDTFDSGIAKALAGQLACMRHVKAYPGINETDKSTQISISVTNYRVTPMYKVMEALRCEAKRYGVTIRRVDMMGLIPERAFIESALYYLGIYEFPPDRLLERSVQKHMAERLQLE